ncbi:MAG: adenine-specific methyltransferase EcoRI family protein [Porticoccaceae bacterium]
MTKAKPKTGNRALSDAKKAKQDEFYTQLGDISNELKHYKAQLSGKTILCNCDDPFESNFFKYFALNFNTLGLKRLIATSYKKSPIVGADLPLFAFEGLKPEGKEPYAIEINDVSDLNGDGATDLADVEYLLKHNANTSRSLNGDGIYSSGDFRSRECVELLKWADIVITNPPFSLFREYVEQLFAHEKQFLIIGSKNAITYKEIFKLIKENRLWLGNGFANGNAFFSTPKDYAREFAAGVYDEKTGLVKFRNVGWFTNMDNPKRHEFIPLYKKYTPDDYPTYDNYNAIEVGKVAEIPADYPGAMGVPITFLDRYNPAQFEIFGITDRDNNSGLKTKEYTEEDAPNPGDLNRRGVIRIGNEYKSTYARLLIKRRS